MYPTYKVELMEQALLSRQRGKVQYYEEKQAEINLDGDDQDSLPRFFSLNDIFSFLKIIMSEQSIQKIFNEGKNVENSQHYNFLKNKRKNIIKGCSNEDINIAQTKRGRKTIFNFME